MSLRSSPRSLARRTMAGLPLAAAFVALFWPTFLWMAERFDARSSFYSHGWAVPLASAWLVWQRRSALRGLPLQPDARGLWLLIPAVSIHVLATWWRLGFVSGFAMIAAVWGLVWMCWGGAALRILRFPLLFLLFMVPLPGILLIATSFRMKLLAASLATQVLHGLGLAAVQAGSTIRVPGASVIVDDTCSGLRSLISLLALATLWTALLPAAATWRQKLLVVAASIPIALVANIARIVVLVLLAAVYGPRAAEGFLHYGSGFVVFGVALATLVWITKRLVSTA